MINPESNVYRIETLKDVFDKVPKDRIDLCMKELGFALTMAKEMQELHTLVGGDPDYEVFPGHVDWVDDDEGQYQFDVSNHGEPLFSVNYSKGAEECQ